MHQSCACIRCHCRRMLPLHAAPLLPLLRPRPQLPTLLNAAWGAQNQVYRRRLAARLAGGFLPWSQPLLCMLSWRALRQTRAACCSGANPLPTWRPPRFLGLPRTCRARPCAPCLCQPAICGRCGGAGGGGAAAPAPAVAPQPPASGLHAGLPRPAGRRLPALGAFRLLGDLPAVLGSAHAAQVFTLGAEALVLSAPAAALHCRPPSQAPLVPPVPLGRRTTSSSCLCAAQMPAAPPPPAVRLPALGWNGLVLGCI